MQNVLKDYSEAAKLEATDPQKALNLYAACQRKMPKTIKRYYLTEIAKYGTLIFILIFIAILPFDPDTASLTCGVGLICFGSIYATIILPIVFLASPQKLPKSLVYSAMAEIGAARCCHRLGDEVGVNHHASRLFNNPLPGFPAAGYAFISMLKGDSDRFFYDLNSAATLSILDSSAQQEFLNNLNLLRNVSGFSVPAPKPPIPMQRPVAMPYPGMPQQQMYPQMSPQATAPGMPQQQMYPQMSPQATAPGMPQQLARKSPVIRDVSGPAGDGKGNVVILREYEHIRGFIRMKMAVANNTPYTVTDVGLELIYDRKVFRLTEIEPEYDREGNKIRIESIPRGDRRSVAFYLDPQICTNSAIDAIVHYRDPGGEMHTITMQRKDVDVVCPIFFTDEFASTAMLKNLVEKTLHHQDSKLFRLPDRMNGGEAFGLARTALTEHNIKKVKEYQDSNPYRAECWFYGKTKVKKNHVAIKISVDEELRVIEIFAAASEANALTGLLAELGHDISRKLEEFGASPVQVTNLEIKDCIFHKSSLMFPEGSGQACANVSVEDSVVNRSKIGE